MYFHFPGLSLALFRLDKCFNVSVPEALCPPYLDPHVLPACPPCAEWRAFSVPGSSKPREVRTGTYTKSHSALYNETCS